MKAINHWIRDIRNTMSVFISALLIVIPGAYAKADPIVLKDHGSFYVGGRTVTSAAVTGSAAGLAGSSNQGDITVDQMYVRYQIPVGPARLPVVMVHGCCLSSKTWETTPDGRTGWDDYFTRHSRPVYLAEQVSRARSGFDATSINEVKLGMLPPDALPYIIMGSHEFAWVGFRFGAKPNQAFADEQFPIAAVDDLYKQMIPDLNGLLPADANPTLNHLATLSKQIGGAVVMGHSESGFFPEQAALVDPTGIKAIISLEPAQTCSTSLSQQQLQTLAKIPILIVFGDHLTDAFASFWIPALSQCQTFAASVRALGGDATVLQLPDAGLKGNSHMMMQDRNNDKVADVLLRWIDGHVHR